MFGEDFIIGINNGFIMLGIIIIVFSGYLTYLGKVEKKNKKR